MMDLDLDALHSPDPGPRDGSILFLQQQHRSREVWDADRMRPVDSKKIRIRSAMKDIRAQQQPSPPVLELIRRARLEALCSLPYVSIDWGLITALAERWRPETHTFHLRHGEATITLQDVEVLLGIPVDGRPMIHSTNFNPQELCLRLLGDQPSKDTGDLNGLKIKASWLRARFTGQVEEGASAEVVARQARGYLFLLMGETIFQNHSVYVHSAILQCLENFDEAGTYSWGSAALAHIYHSLCHGCRRSKKEMVGYFVLVQVWAWERLPYLSPGRLGKRAPKAGAPLIGRWDDIFHSPDLVTHVLGAYRYHLDIQAFDEVTWTPYSEELLQSLPEYCRAGRHIWRASVLLIYYATVQYHQPERVMRQFGFRQGIPPPPPPSRSLDPPHGKTFQSGQCDWVLKYRTTVDAWNDRNNRVVPSGDIDLVDYPFDDPYMAWYENITRRCISRVGAGVDGVTRCLKALITPDTPAPYRDIALAGLNHMAVLEKFLRLEPPQQPNILQGGEVLEHEGDIFLEEQVQALENVAGHDHDHPHVEHPNDHTVPVHDGPQPSFSPYQHFEQFVMSPSVFDSPVDHPTIGRGSSSQTGTYVDMSWEDVQVSGFGAECHDSLLEAKRKRIGEMNLGDVSQSLGDGDITQTDDVHADHVEADEGEEVGEDIDIGGEDFQSTTNETCAIYQRRSKRIRKKKLCGTGGTMCNDGRGKTKRHCH